MHTFKTKFQQPVIPAFMVRNLSSEAFLNLSVKESLIVLTFVVFKLPVGVLPPAGVERQFFSSDGPPGSQHGAERPEEKQRHQQLQRQPDLDSIPSASRTPPGSTTVAAAEHHLCPGCGPSHIMEELPHWNMMAQPIPHAVCVLHDDKNRFGNK